MPLTFNYTGELNGDEIKLKRELMGFPAEESSRNAHTSARSNDYT